MGQTKEPTEVEKIKGYVNQEVKGNLSYKDEIAILIGMTDVPLNENKNPDMGAYIELLNKKIQPIAAKHFGNGRDPEWYIGPADLQQILDSVGNPFNGEGKLRKDAKDQIEGAYVSKSRQYAINRAIGRGDKTPELSDEIEYATSLAQDSNPGLAGLVKGVKNRETLRRRLPTIVNEYFSSQERAYSATGQPPV